MQETLSRKEKEKLRIQEIILHSATTLFEEKGLEAVTMDDIAAKSEFSKGTLYNYFKNKNDLICELIIRKVSIIHENLAKIILHPNKNFREKLSLFLSSFLEVIEADKVVFKLISPKKFFLYDDENRLKEHFGKHMQNLKTLCQIGIDEKTLKPMDPLLLAFSLMGNIRVFVEFCVEQTCQFSTLSIPQKKDIVTELFMKGAGNE